MLPFAPEPGALLAARYRATVAEVVDPVAVERGERPTPGTDRRHVFDFEDGVRLIVSRDLVELGCEVTHFSASVGAGREERVVRAYGLADFLGLLRLPLPRDRRVPRLRGVRRVLGRQARPALAHSSAQRGAKGR